MLTDDLGLTQTEAENLSKNHIFRSSIQSQSHNTGFQHYTLYISGAHS